MCNKIICIGGINKHYQFIKRQYHQIKKILPDVDVCITSAGNINDKPQCLLYSLAKQLNIQYFQFRQEYFQFSKIKKWIKPFVGYSEVMHELQLSKLLYDRGYDYVYINHPDVKVFKDWTLLVQDLIDKSNYKFSFVRPLIDSYLSLKRTNKYKLVQQEHLKMGYNDIYKKQSAVRLQPVTSLWNKQLVYRLYKEYPTQQQLYDYIQKPFDLLPSDMILFDINKLLIKDFGYRAITIPNKYVVMSNRFVDQNTHLYHYCDNVHRQHIGAKFEYLEKQELF